MVEASECNGHLKKVAIFFYMKRNSEEILDFWFNILSERDWFSKSDEIDDMIRRRFREHLLEAGRGELFYWRENAMGRLAEIIVLDQFSRNIYRGTAAAFQNDALALILAQEMVYLGLNQQLDQKQKIFSYMPFMHSESRVIHEQAIHLFTALGDEETLKFEELHKDIIDKFGRFPHRNKIIGRNSTLREEEFLKQHSGF